MDGGNDGNDKGAACSDGDGLGRVWCRQKDSEKGFKTVPDSYGGTQPIPRKHKYAIPPIPNNHPSITRNGVVKYKHSRGRFEAMNEAFKRLQTEGNAVESGRNRRCKLVI